MSKEEQTPVRRRGGKMLQRGTKRLRRPVQTKLCQTNSLRIHSQFSSTSFPFDADHAPAPRSALCVARRAPSCQTRSFSCPPASSICIRRRKGAQSAERNAPPIESVAERRRRDLFLSFLLCPDARPDGLPGEHLPQPGGGGRARPPGQEEEDRRLGVCRLVRHGEFFACRFFFYSWSFFGFSSSEVLFACDKKLETRREKNSLS